MYSDKINKAILLLTLTVTVGCSASLYQPVPEDATSDVSFETLVEGRKLYVTKCGSCHSLYLPHQYSATVWKTNLDEMQERSKMSDSEKEKVYAFLTHTPHQAPKSN